MRFPRNARIFRGQLDAAPFLSVLFLLVMFMLLGSLIYTPGLRVPLELPRADDLPGTDGPTVAVAVGRDGQLYYENQMISEADLKRQLHEAAQKSHEPLTLIVHADRSVTYENIIRLKTLAHAAGIEDALFAVLPGSFSDASSGGRNRN